MKVWKYCAGCVNIGIMGKYPERLINLCVSNGIRLRRLERQEWGASALISPSDFKRLHGLSRGSGARIRILGRRGAPGLGKRFKRDAVFLTALAVMALAIFAASTRVWFIHVDTVSIPETEVRDRLKGLGVFVGAGKRSFRTSEVAKKLDLDPRVVNAKVKLEGVSLSVTLAETVGEAGSSRETSPSSIYADRDCIIRFITTAKGRQKVSAGQAVRKGDLLISGDLTEAKEGLFVRADGLILGEVPFVAEASASRSVERNERTGAFVTARGISLFGRELILGVPFESYELEPADEGMLRASPFPITVREYVCWETAQSLVSDTDGGTEERARLLAQERLNGILPKDARIVAVGTECKLNSDGSVTARVTVTAVVEIGFRRDIDGS